MKFHYLLSMLGLVICDNHHHKKNCFHHPNFPKPLLLPELPFPFPGIPKLDGIFPEIENDLVPIPFGFPFGPPDFALFQNCHVDRETYCSDLAPPYTAEGLFTNDCFKKNLDKLSKNCKNMYDAFHKGPRHFDLVVNIVVSGPCFKDKKKLCADKKLGNLKSPWELFTQPCIANNVNKLSTSCKKAYQEFTDAHTKNTIPPHYVPNVHVEVLRLPVNNEQKHFPKLPELPSPIQAPKIPSHDKEHEETFKHDDHHNIGKNFGAFMGEISGAADNTKEAFMDTINSLPHISIHSVRHLVANNNILVIIFLCITAFFAISSGILAIIWKKKEQKMFPSDADSSKISLLIPYETKN